MSKYQLTAIVDRTVTDTINLTVNADDEGEAYLVARRVLDKFPDAHEEDNVPFCQIVHRHNHSPMLVEITPEEDQGVA